MVPLLLARARRHARRESERLLLARGCYAGLVMGSGSGVFEQPRQSMGDCLRIEVASYGMADFGVTAGAVETVFGNET